MSLQIRNVNFETGRPQVAISLTGKTYEEIIQQCEKAVSRPVQVIEWRADFYLAEIDNIEEKLVKTDIYLEMLNILDGIREIIGEMPLIFTLRTGRQGGCIELSNEQIEGIQEFVAESNLVDLVDVEIRGLKKKNGGIGGNLLVARVKKLHELGARVILSYHEFDEMIPSKDIVRLVGAMTNYKGDMYKVAAMAHDTDDAKEMIRATAYLTREQIGPVITMAMGKAGAATRIIGGKYGSVITFAALDRASAPGQIEAGRLAEKLDEVYGAK